MKPKKFLLKKIISVLCKISDNLAVVTDFMVNPMDEIIGGTSVINSDYLTIAIYSDKTFGMLRNVADQYDVGDKAFFQIKNSLNLPGLSYQVTNCALEQDDSRFNFVKDVRKMQ